MIRCLQRRLTALFTAGTSLVLGLSLLVTYGLFCEQMESDRRMVRQQNIQDVINSLARDAVLSDRRLSELESAGQMVISITDNGASLYFPGAWQTAESRRRLVETALQLAAAQGVDTAHPGQVQDMALTDGKGAHYWASVSILTQGQEQFGVTILHSRSEELAVRRSLALQHVLIFLAGIAGLAVLSWAVVRRALRPTVQSLQRQNEFIAAASHELRSPLAVIRASLSAAGQAEDTAQAHRFMSAADSEAARMGRLVDDLLVLAGSDTGAWHVSLQPVELEGFAIGLFDHWLALCRQTGHTLHLDLPEGRLPSVRADRERLDQLLGILLSNACEYTPSGTDVTIAVRCSRRHAAVSVIDRGPGIPADRKEQIFQRFARGDASRTKRTHFGLGLSVAQELAHLHAGNLTCTDTPGGGATFTLTLPLSR